MKTFLATFIGIVISIATMMGVQIVGHFLFPLPFELDQNNYSDLAEKLHLIPTGALAFVLLSHAASLIIGLLIAKMIDKLTVYPLYIIAGFLMFGTVANLIAIPHPTWFIFADIGIMLIISIPFILNARKSL